MKNEIKKQLLLSLIILFVIILTLFIWYDNFMFHTYVSSNTYQYCFKGENSDFQINGYEFYQLDNILEVGHARILCYQSDLLLEDDEVTISFYVNDDVHYEQTLEVSYDNEVLNMSLQDYDDLISIDDFDNPYILLSINGDNEKVYENEIKMINQDIVTFTGSNKDYTISNVYMTSSWLKTGDFSSKIEDLEDQYPYITIDYMYANEEIEVNEYERFAYISGNTKDILDNSNHQVVYYDSDDSLLDKDVICVITLMTSEDDSNPYTFTIELKVVEAYE
ncbi:MAG: hypothetical protein LUF02_07970 [Erysipelotrichaceae bacterium]|nr:hypothetical protein [Erysipelotrichaceae bacterium]